MAKTVVVLVDSKALQDQIEGLLRAKGHAVEAIFTAGQIPGLIDKLDREAMGHITVGNTSIKQEFRNIEIEGRVHQFPAKEFFLLQRLSEDAGRIFTRDELLSLVWGAKTGTATNVLEVTVSNLRKRLESLGSSMKIKNSRNLGYWVEN